MSLNLLSALRPQAFRTATWTYSLMWAGSFPRPGLRILMYHAVGTPIHDDRRGMYNITPDRFREHMQHLADGYRERVGSLDFTRSENQELRVAVTFDDGYQDNLLAAAPVLTELRIPFSVFVCTGAVSERKPGFLTPEQLRELAAMPGATIGSHSVSHPRLTDVDDRRLREELAGSKKYLEDLLGREVYSLSYPEGAVDRRVRDAAESAGYRMGATSRFDINPPGRDPLLLCRTDIWADDDVKMFHQKIDGHWDWNRWRHPDVAVA